MLVDLIIRLWVLLLHVFWFVKLLAGNFEFFKLTIQFICMLGVVACLLVRGIGSFLEWFKIGNVKHENKQFFLIGPKCANFYMLSTTLWYKLPFLALKKKSYRSKRIKVQKISYFNVSYNYCYFRIFVNIYI